MGLGITPSKLTRETRRLKQQVARLLRGQRDPKVNRRHQAFRPKPDYAAIQDCYAQSELASMPETFALWRIIGNDLVPRHRKGQSRDNLAFMLDHEPELRDCQKHWLLNRIHDADVEAAIIKLLQSHNQPFHRIPFDIDEYAKQPWDMDGIPIALRSRHCDAFGPDSRSRLEQHIRRRKNIYAINNNGARNTTILLGRNLAKWVLPWDGNCFVTESAWESIVAAVNRQAYLPYFIVPMARVENNSRLLNTDFNPPANEEPQVILRRDAKEMFDERLPYGRWPKVELLWRLGVTGIWDRYSVEPFDIPRPTLALEAYQYAKAGWVARLESGAPYENGPRAAKDRNRAREEAVINFLDGLDQSVLQQGKGHGIEVCARTEASTRKAQPALPGFRY